MRGPGAPNIGRNLGGGGAWGLWGTQQDNAPSLLPVTNQLLVRTCLSFPSFTIKRASHSTQARKFIELETIVPSVYCISRQ